MSCCECTSTPPCVMGGEWRNRQGSASRRCFFVNAGTYYKSLTRGGPSGNIGRTETYEDAWTLPCVLNFGGTGYKIESWSGTFSDGTYAITKREDYTYDPETGEQTVTYSGTASWSRGGPTTCGGFFDPETGEWAPEYTGSYSRNGSATRAANGLWTITVTEVTCGLSDTDVTTSFTDPVGATGGGPVTVELSHPTTTYTDEIPFSELESRANDALGAWSEWYSAGGTGCVTNQRDENFVRVDQAQVRLVHPPSPSGYLKVWLVRDESEGGETTYFDHDTYEWRGTIAHPELPYWHPNNLITSDPLDVPSSLPAGGGVVSRTVCLRVEKWSCVEGWEPRIDYATGEYLDQNGYPGLYDPAIVEGCTDALATNYNPAANLDDGSCIYG